MSLLSENGNAHALLLIPAGPEALERARALMREAASGPERLSAEQRERLAKSWQLLQPQLLEVKPDSAGISLKGAGLDLDIDAHSVLLQWSLHGDASEQARLSLRALPDWLAREGFQAYSPTLDRIIDPLTDAAELLARYQQQVEQGLRVAAEHARVRLRQLSIAGGALALSLAAVFLFAGAQRWALFLTIALFAPFLFGAVLLVARYLAAARR